MSVPPAPQGVPAPAPASAAESDAGPRQVAAHRQAVEDLLRAWFRDHPPARETVELSCAAGRLLAADVQAPGNLPPFTN